MANQNPIWIGGVPIKFPYSSPYVPQKQLMFQTIRALNEGHHALLESPTGSGKSLAILCSVLAWHAYTYGDSGDVTGTKHKHIKIDGDSAHSDTDTDTKTNPFAWTPKASDAQSATHARSTRSSAPKIIFTSRTHSQIQQLVTEYRRTAYPPQFRMVVLGSRKSLCINSRVRPLSDRNDKCQKARDLKDCRYYRSRQYAEEFKKSNEFSSGKAFDIEDMVSVGTKRGLCPYFGARAILEQANVIFCPYNYILDPVTRSQMKINIKDSIIIIDEAHNAEDVCRNALTKSYTLDDIKLSVANLKLLKNQTGVDELPQNVYDAASNLEGLMKRLEKWMEEAESELTKQHYINDLNIFPHPKNGTNKISSMFQQKLQYDYKAMVKHKRCAKTLLDHFRNLKKETTEPDSQPNRYCALRIYMFVFMSNLNVLPCPDPTRHSHSLRHRTTRSSPKSPRK